MSDGTLWLGCALAAGGVAVLRLSWGRPHRDRGLNALGWAGIAGGTLLAGLSEGAWGVAVAVLCATSAAALLLAHSAVEKPRAARRSAPTVRIAASAARPARPIHGLTTFVLGGPLALAVAVVLALAIRVAAMRWPVAEADGNVMVLALVPLLWPLLAFAMLMTERRRAQFAMLLVPLAGAAVPLLLLGSAA
ncbi:hypothetical protein [Qipengyuania sp.]|uniref:hypothetical protein n=1 Tax=Qipengyuania sp. TaxID=2004515 RepID=UPI0035125DB6